MRKVKMDTGRGLTEQNWSIFGKRLKDELVKQGISYRQFADKAGLTLTTVHRYANSLRIPRATEIIKSAEVLGVTCDYMLGLSDNPHKTRSQPESCKDTIIRQDAINAIMDADVCVTWNGVISDDDAVDIAIRATKGSVIGSIAKLPSALAKDTNVPITDCISRQDAMDLFPNDDLEYDTKGGYIAPHLARQMISELPSAQPEPISEAYEKAVFVWLLNYQIKAAELQGRYTPYDVLSWVANDWRKEHER